MNKLTQMEIVLGIKVIREHIDPKNSSITISDCAHLKSAILSTIEFMRKVDSRIVLSFDYAEAWFKITMDMNRFDKACINFNKAMEMGILDGKILNKEIFCTRDEVADYVSIISALCSYGVYGGYVYDNAKNSLIAFAF